MKPKFVATLAALAVLALIAVGIGTGFGVTGATAQDATVVTLTDDNFAAEALAANQVVVIDMYATWCGPCKYYKPIFEKVASDYADKAKFARVDVDANPKISGFFGISAIPVTVLLKKDASGKTMAFGLRGVPSEEGLKKAIDFVRDPSSTGKAIPEWK